MGALPARCHEMSRRWVRAGHRVSVIAGIPNYPAGRVYPGYEGRAFVHEIIDGINVYRSWVYVTPNAGSLKRSVNFVTFGLSAILVANALERVDVCIASSPQLLAGFAGGVVSRMIDAPFVLEVRDLWPDSIEAVGLSMNRRAYHALQWIERRMYHAADRIVVVSRAFRDHIIDCGVDAAHLAVVTNGIDSSMFDVPATARQEFTGALAGKCIVMYAGTIGMAHGLEILLDAARSLADLPDVHIVIAGDGAERQRLAALIAGMPNVTYVGRHPRQTIARMWLESDVGVVLLRDTPLFRTVIPSKMFEVMAAGRPLVLGVDGEARRIMDEAGAGTAIPPGDAERLADAIRAYHADPALRAAHGHAGAAHVRAHFDFELLADRYLHLLQEVAA